MFFTRLLYICIAYNYSIDCVKCNTMYKRAEYQKIKSRLEEDRKFIQVVMGARQIGKSTVVKQVLKDLSLPYQFFSANLCTHLLAFEF